MTPPQTSTMAASCQPFMPAIPLMTMVATATSAPELLQMGEDIESSIYRSPM